MMTPLHIEILLHYHCRPGNFPRQAPACQEYETQLMDWGLIEAVKFAAENAKVVFRITPRGSAHLMQMCNLPLPEPVLVWVGADGKVIEGPLIVKAQED